MAKPNKVTSVATPAMLIHNAIRGVATAVVNSLPDKKTARGVSVSLESYQAEGVDSQRLDDASETVAAQLDSMVIGDGVSNAALNDTNGEPETGGIEYTTNEGDVATMREHQAEVSNEAVRLLMLGSNNIHAWVESGLSEPSFESGVNVNKMRASGVAGNIGVTTANTRPSMEAFVEAETDKYRELSYTINWMAAKSHEMIELFYRSYITTPDEAAFVLPIRRNVVFNVFRHNEKGDFVRLRDHQVNVMESLLDHKVLDTESTRLIPCVTDENREHFIDPALIANQPATQDGEVFETNYLKIGARFTLVGVSQTPARMQKGVPNWTDALDARVALDELVITVNGKPFILNVNRATKAAFQPNREQHQSDMNLDFRPEFYNLTEKNVIDPNTGEIVEPLKALYEAGYELRLEMRLNGTVNLFTSSTEVYSNLAKISRVVAKHNPNEAVPLDDKEVAPLIAGLKFEVVGYSPEARLSNVNQLEQGLLIDSDVRREGFLIPTLYPFTIMKPTQVDDEKVFPTIEALTTTVRISMRNNGVTALLNRREDLRNTLGNDRVHKIESCLDLEGVGQYYIRPYFLEGEIDLLHDLNSLKSSEKLSDIRGLINARITEGAYRADMMTGYSSALEVAFPGSTPKLHLGIGTDKRLPQYMMIPGDDRTFGIGMNHTIASISDLRMKNLIIASFVLPSVKDIHPLHFGVLGQIPEYLVNFDMIRDQRISNEIRLTPRYRYFNFLPLMMVWTVKHLEETIAMRTALNVNTLDVKAFPGAAGVVEGIDGGDTDGGDTGTGEEGNKKKD